MNRHIEVIPGETRDALRRYPWPGNVRELENLIHRAVILSLGVELRLPPAALQALPSRNTGERSDTLEGLQRAHIMRVLEETNWIISGGRGAAARLGLKRTTLQSRLKRLGLVPSRRCAGEETVRE
jgi:formate hydrogenlyase transcriptional activator